ncbi:MAG: HepT-like ribonuclease domain-containing protein [Acidimicrobiales bacterium]
MSRFDAAVTLDETRVFLGRLAELAGAGEAGFLASWRDQAAAQMLVVKLAEAVGRLPDVVLERRAEVPWHQIRGMRHRLVHAYHDTDAHVLWATVASDAPKLLEMVERAAGDAAGPHSRRDHRGNGR